MRLPRVLLCWLLLAGVGHAAPWTRYVAPDQSYSFHYPTGWSASLQNGLVQVDCDATGEQLLLIPTATQPGQTAQDAALGLVEALRSVVPSLQVSQWDELDPAGRYALAQLSYSEAGKPCRGDALCVLTEGVAFWFEYSCPLEQYLRPRARAVMDAFIGSFENDASSKPPQSPIPDLATARLDRNAEAFLFVVEFGTGVAFSAAQEKVVRDRVVEAWRQLPTEEAARYDQYPEVMKVILALKQENLAAVQSEVRQTLREALAQAADDAATAAIREALKRSSETLAPGEPALPAAAADAYAELLGFTRAVSAKPTAGPENIELSYVEGVRADLISAWSELAPQDKQAVLTTPALWMAVRQVFRQGTAAEKREVLENLSSLAEAAPATGPPPKPGQAAGGGKTMTDRELSAELVRRYIKHQTFMKLQQQPFNAYLWSRPFSGWTPQYGMW